MHYLALDIGSSFIKSVVFDLDHLEMASLLKKNTPDKQPSRFPGRYEVDPNGLFQAILELIQAQFSRYPGIQGIMLSTQMHGFVLAKKNGEAITPYISWQDERCLEIKPGSAETYLQYLQNKLPSELLGPAGVPLKAGLALCNLYHWLDEYKLSGLSDQTRLCTLGSYIISRLTGSFACHITNAAATGFADIARGEWNRPLIREAGCDGLDFPAILKETEPAGYFAGPSGPVPVFPDIGDHQASVLGSFAAQQNDIVMTVGTAGLLSRIDDGFDRGNYEVRPYFEGRYLHTVTRIPGGRNLDVLVRFIRDVGERVFDQKVDDSMVWEKVIGLARKASTSRLHVQLGFFPQQQGVEKGSIERIDADNLLVDQLFQAAFAHLGHIYDEQINKLCTDRSSLERLVFTGGVAWKIGLLTEQITAQTGLPAVMAPLPDESLAGLFRLSLVCSGRCRDLSGTREILLQDRAANRSVLRFIS